MAGLFPPGEDPAHLATTCSLSHFSPLPLRVRRRVLRQTLSQLCFWAPAPSRQVDLSGLSTPPPQNSTSGFGPKFQLAIEGLSAGCGPLSRHLGRKGGSLRPEAGAPASSRCPPHSPSVLAATPHGPASTLQTSAHLPGVQAAGSVLPPCDLPWQPGSLRLEPSPQPALLSYPLKAMRPWPPVASHLRAKGLILC